MIATAPRALSGANTLTHPRLALVTAPATIVLALILGPSTGWALRGRDGAVASGVQEFRPNHFDGTAFLRFQHWLSEHNEIAGPITAVFFEEPRADRGTLAAHIHRGFLARLEAWAEFRDVACEGVPVATVTRFATSRDDAGTAEVIAAVRRMGFEPADGNEAKAIALLRWALAHRAGGVR